MAVWTNFADLTLVSAGFLLLFTAFNTCQNFITKMLSDDELGSLGFSAITCLYVFFAATSFFSASIVNKIGRSNLSLSLGASGYAFFTACFLLPAYMAKKKHDGGDIHTGFLSKVPISIFYYVTAAMCGAGAGIIWTAQGSYVNRAACEENKGFYNSWAWAWFMASQLIGNPIAGAILRSGGLEG